LHVHRPDRWPGARCLIAYLAPERHGNGVLLRDAIVRLPLDARGAASAAARAGVLAAAGVVTNVGWAATAVLTLPAGPTSSRVWRCRTARDACASSLRDRDGAPIPGAQPHLGGTSTESSGDPVQNLLSQSLASTRSLWARLRTDADGRLAIPFVPVVGMKRRLALHWEGGASNEFELVADEVAGGDGFEVRPK
jgi:hypothetical protein